MSFDESHLPTHKHDETVVGHLTVELLHEFNNLLQGIMGLAEIIEMDEPLSEEGIMAIQGIQGLAKETRDLIQGVKKSKATYVESEKIYQGPERKEVEEGQKEGKQEPAILLVEDDHFVLNVVTRMLRELGHKTLQARDGLEALDLYFDNFPRIKLVISDLKMPRMGGIELAEKIYEHNPNVKFVIMTGYLRENAPVDLDELNFTGWLEKPMTADRLKQVVASALGSKKEKTPSVAEGDSARR
ncbi:MAG: response regulator [Promethearchaeia archaeon]